MPFFNTSLVFSALIAQDCHKQIFVFNYQPQRYEKDLIMVVFWGNNFPQDGITKLLVAIGYRRTLFPSERKSAARSLSAMLSEAEVQSRSAVNLKLPHQIHQHRQMVTKPINKRRSLKTTERYTPISPRLMNHKILLKNFRPPKAK